MLVFGCYDGFANLDLITRDLLFGGVGWCFGWCILSGQFVCYVIGVGTVPLCVTLGFIDCYYECFG